MSQNKLTAQSISNEWCEDGEYNGTSFAKMTNIMGGPEGEETLQWLDYDNSLSTFSWNPIPKYKFFVSPTNSDTANDSYMMRATQGFEPNNNLLCSSTIPTCNLSDVRDCSIGHRQSQADYWGIPQDYCTTGPNVGGDDCVNLNYSGSKGKSWWGRAPINNGVRGPSLCNVVADVAKQDNASQHYNTFYLDGSSKYPTSQFYNSSEGQHNQGCYMDGGCPLDGTPDLVESKCNGKMKSNPSYSKWISNNTAAACCAMTGDEATNSICGTGAFNPSAPGNKCQEMMYQYCPNNWNFCAVDENSEECQAAGSQTCLNYLRSGSSISVQNARQVISSYINDPSRGEYIDYVSPKLKNISGSTSQKYYQQYNCTSDPSTYDSSNPCSRDDSTDSFFIDSLPFLCNTPQTGSCIPPATGVCDPLLGYFCQQFGREELEKDETLFKMCGCMLLPLGQTEIPKPTISWTDDQGNTEYWKNTVGQPQDQSPYYITDSSQNCDPICVNSTIQPCQGICQNKMCIIDNVTVNVINSSTGDITLEQTCNCAQSGGSCVCYIGDVDVNDVTGDAQVQITQSCNTCYYFTDGDLRNAQLVDCETLTVPSTPGEQPSSEPPKDAKRWYMTTTAQVFFVIVAILLVLLLSIWLFYRQKPAAKTEYEIYEPSDPNSFYYY